MTDWDTPVQSVKTERSTLDLLLSITIKGKCFKTILFNVKCTDMSQGGKFLEGYKKQRVIASQRHRTYKAKRIWGFCKTCSVLKGLQWGVNSPQVLNSPQVG